ncbi:MULTISPECIES: glycosyltransferase family 2 protein [Cellulomonas]|uniref:Glycosyl transferase n=2 Tax=Cellulomonas TaxID=1707 RepID=A0A4Y3KM68_9CELL|nr:MULTISPECIES: glycosyltransferase family 2 protein [Cellulomonas]MCR6705723.1 glycosyltransferase family 2 protein [Cellulomonas sp.]GEA85122.1 hypothetical protein CGE01nite_23730 [Cellulomonas gelida]GGL15595.1 hypothetical protein GCM10009774_02530 [Cellulomonas gelida]
MHGGQVETRTSERTRTSVPPDRLVVLVPAHDEADAIGGTLAALAEQTGAPQRVVVIADNCTDDTADVARRHGAEVVETVANTARKAGALDQALVRLRTSPAQYVLVVDADTRLAPAFVETALARLDADVRLGAVSGIFVGERPRSVLQQLQANEYERYRTQILTTQRVSVVTGTASMFRLTALDEVAAERGRRLPGSPGDVYDRTAITEDSELTLALKTLGWRLEAPQECVCLTELMPTWGDLHRQRVRWYKGMLDNLREYGFTRTTARYVGQQLMIGVGMATLALLTVLTVASVVAGVFAVSPFWLAIGGVFVVNRLVTVWPVGRDGRLLAAAVIPEIVYDAALQAAFLRAVVCAAARRDVTWNHVTANPTGAP